MACLSYRVLQVLVTARHTPDPIYPIYLTFPRILPCVSFRSHRSCPSPSPTTMSNLPMMRSVPSIFAIPCIPSILCIPDFPVSHICCPIRPAHCVHPTSPIDHVFQSIPSVPSIQCILLTLHPIPSIQLVLSILCVSSILSI